MTHPAMWFEVLGNDGGKLRKFYSELFGWGFDVTPILSKVAGVLPKDLEPLLADTRLFVPSLRSSTRSSAGLAVAREALVARRRLHLSYANEKGEESARTIRPLGVFFWGRTWTLAAWCEMRTDFRNFRLDRISEATMGERFADEPGRTPRDMLQQYGPAAVKLLDP